MRSLAAFALQIVILAMVSVSCRSLQSNHSTQAKPTHASLNVQIDIPAGIDSYGVDGVAILKAKSDDGSVSEFRTSVIFDKSAAYVSFDRDTAGRMLQMGANLTQISVSVVDREGRLLLSGRSHEKSLQILSSAIDVPFAYECRVQECMNVSGLASDAKSDSERMP